MFVIIMRGLPGSGKSTWVQTYSYKQVVCSADDYHMVDGVYKFDPKNSGRAHDACFKKFTELALQLRSPWETPEFDYLIVDNTNATAAEIAPYARLAQAFGIPFKITYLMCSPEVSCARNVHGVPVATILRMYRHLLLEEIPPYWPQEIIVR